MYPDSSASFLKYRTPTNPANAPAAAPTDWARVRRDSPGLPAADDGPTWVTVPGEGEDPD